MIMLMYKVIGVDYNNNEKRLVLMNDDDDQVVISRTIHDIKRIARAAKASRPSSSSSLLPPPTPPPSSSSSSSSTPLPLSPLHIYKIPKELRKLLDNDIFRVNSYGYDKNMIKAIQVTQCYINFILNNIDDDNRQIFINEDKYNQNVQCINEKRINEKRPRLLQQFFTKYNDITDLINLAIINNDDTDNTVFIEPSCGDGRILLELCKRDYKCFGIDIDDQILEKAKTSLKVYDNNNLLGLLACDFLTLSKTQLPILEDKKIIVIGNPPYRDTFCNDDNEQDYTMRFIKQCKEWNASRIAFILPSRAAKSEFLKKIEKDYRVVKIKEDLEGKFQFMGDKEISQPSIMMILDVI